MRHTVKVVAAGLVAMSVAGFGIAHAAQVATDETDEYGTFLTDGTGMSLYMFEADTQGSGDTPAKSNCSAACAEAWPPLLEDQGTPQVNGMAKQDLVGTITRDDGSVQVTYNGWPLYYFKNDTKPGATEGQAVEGFGGEWYLVSPDGENVEGEGE